MICRNRKGVKAVKPLWTVLTTACVLLPLVYVLYYFGILVTQATASWFRADISLPTRWEGRTLGTTGLMRRNFSVFRRYQQLSIETETNSGAIECEVRGPDGSLLSPASGSYGRDASFLIDVSQYRRCAVTLKMRQFDGHFRVTLQ